MIGWLARERFLNGCVAILFFVPMRAAAYVCALIQHCVAKFRARAGVAAITMAG